MNTPHLICVFHNGRFEVAQYGRWDGFMQGARLMTFLRVPINIQRLKHGLNHTYSVSIHEIIEANRQINRLPLPEFNAFQEFVKDLTTEFPSNIRPSLFSGTGAAVLEVISRAEAGKEVPIELDLLSVMDEEFCEFAYVVDLDKEVLEVFSGHAKKTPNHRFGNVGGKDVMVPIHISSFTFSKLQSMESGQEVIDQVTRDMNLIRRRLTKASVNYGANEPAPQRRARGRPRKTSVKHGADESTSQEGVRGRPVKTSVRRSGRIKRQEVKPVYRGC